MGDFEDKLAVKRAEEKSAAAQAQKAKGLARAEADAARKYVNPVRREEASRRFTELRSPAVPAARPSPPQPPPASGEPVEFYVFKDGVIGKITFAATTAFEPL